MSERSRPTAGPNIAILRGQWSAGTPIYRRQRRICVGLLEFDQGHANRSNYIQIVSAKVKVTPVENRL